MGTLLDLKNSIASQVFRADAVTSLTATQSADIDRALVEAASLEQVNGYYFNETRATAPMEAGRQYYPLPSDYLKFINLSYLYSGSRRTLEAITFDDAEELDRPDWQSYPGWYTIVDEQIRVIPTPNSAYVMTLYFYSVLGLPAGDSAQNFWTNTGEPLIRNRAASLLCAGPLRDPEQAALYNRLADTHLAALKARSLNHRGELTVKPMEM